MSDTPETTNGKSTEQMRRALAAIEKLQAKVARLEAAKNEPIAILGMSCRFPGADSPEEFWQMLSEGRDAITEAPVDRPGDWRGQKGGFVRGVDRFDAPFWGISPREARTLDPQQRILLEVAHEALERSGQSMDALRKTQTGIFVAISSNDYGAILATGGGADAFYFATGNNNAFACGRLSFLLEVQGPSMAIDTACSSSLVALDLACQSLRNRTSDVAIAAGVSLMLAPFVSGVIIKMQVISPEFRCKTFDATADGYARSEGCGAVVLKRLSDAIADGDPILAVVRGTAVNHDGRSASMTAPNPIAQRLVLQRAVADARVAPEQISYVEAHGTGTLLGDPIEVGALKEVYGAPRADGTPCLLGAVKTNIGHLEPAAGIAGLIKTTLALHHEAVPAHLNFKTLSPHISFEGTRFDIPTATRPWPRGKEPRFAGISSFGMSGTNAHVILEEAPAPPANEPTLPAGSRVLTLSARSPEALRALAERYAERIPSPGRRPDGVDESDAWLARACATTNVRRAHYEHRLALVARTCEQTRTELLAFAQGEKRPTVWSAHASSTRREVVFVFPGYGSQWAGMGRRLIDSEPAFRTALEACDAAIATHTGWSVIERLRSDEGVVIDADILQPMVFAVQVALAALWRAWGVEPHAVIGHSLGEIAAAHVAGALSLEDAARLACIRGKLARKAKGRGGMIVTDLPPSAAAEAIRPYDGRLDFAGINAPGSSLISGDLDALKALSETLAARDVFCRTVEIDYASHSGQMDPLATELRAALEGLAPSAARIAIYSTVTGQPLAAKNADAAYWAKNLREPVLFHPAIERLVKEGYDLFVEVSGHPVLGASIERTLAVLGKKGVSAPTLRKGQNERDVMLDSLARLHTLGCRVEWSKQYPRGLRAVELPTYPWQRERYWSDGDPGRTATSPLDLVPHPLLGLPTPAIHTGARSWDRTVVQDGADDGTNGRHLGIAISVARECFKDSAFELESLTVEHDAPPPTEGGIVRQQTVATPAQNGTAGQMIIQVATAHWNAKEPSWLKEPKWLIEEKVLASRAAAPTSDLTLAEVRARCTRTVPADDVKTPLLLECELFTGAQAQEQRELLVRLVSDLSIPEEVMASVSALDALVRIAHRAATGETEPVHPLEAVGKVRAAARAWGANVWAYARASRTGGPGERAADVMLFADDGQVLAEMTGLRFSSAPSEAALGRWMYRFVWERAARSTTPTSASSGRVWLLVGAHEDAKDLARAIDDEGERAIVVDAALGLEPAITKLAADGTSPHAVVHLVPAAAPADEVVAVVQALARATATPQLWIVTRGADSVEGERTSLAHATIAGLARTIMHEHPELRCHRVDLATADDVKAVLDELRTDAHEDQVVLRGADRFVARLLRAPMSLRHASIEAAGTYLVTGGLGGLGLEVAEWLAARGAKHLVLAGRSGGSAEAQAAVEKMRASGVDVKIERGDVGSAEDVARLVERANPKDAPLRGVLHTAGVLDDGVLTGQTPERFARVMRPKALGAWNLHLATRELPLDFFVLFSSMASVIGSAGQGNYAAANAYLDALAHHRRALDLPATSVNWGAWREVGMAAAQENRGDRMAAHGLLGLSNAEGLAALDRVLAHRPVQIGVARIGRAAWKTMLMRDPVPRLLAYFDEEVRASEKTEAGPPALLEVLRSTPPSDRRAVVETHVRAELASYIRLNPDQIDGGTSLLEYGFDSLMALEFRNWLTAALGRALPMAKMFRAPTVNGILDLVAEQAEIALATGASVESPDAGGGDAVAAAAAMSAVPDDSLAEMRKDAVLDPRVVLATDTAAPRRGPPARVLLTGASGFLGAFLLRDLLLRTTADVHCLVRAPDVEEGHARLRQNLETYGLWDDAMRARIFPVPGDLTLRAFGLTEERFTELGIAVDAIYHNGAVVNLLAPYPMIKGSNVLGTQEVLRMACFGTPKPVHHISTGAVFFTRTAELRTLSETDPLGDGEGLQNGYSQSKWVAEQLVWQAKDRGLPVRVYRPGPIGPDASSGTFNVDDAVARLLLACIEIGELPDLDFAIDMAPVDYVSRGIVELSLSDAQFGNAYHLMHPEPVTVAAIGDWLGRLGYAVKRVPLGDWLVHFAMAAQNPKSAFYPLRVLISPERLVGRWPRFDCTNAGGALAARGIKCPPMSVEMLGTVLGCFERAGLLAKPVRAQRRGAEREGETNAE